MSITVKRGLIGKEDVNWYSAASPTFHRTDSSGNATERTSIGASQVPIMNATGYFSQSTVERAIQETISRYFGIKHSVATWDGGALVGHHQDVYGFANALAATSIQAAASRQFLEHGVACVVIPAGTHTAATRIHLPKNTFILGAGRRTIVRQNATNKTSAVFYAAGSIGATQSNITSNATVGCNHVNVVDGTKFSAGEWIKVADSHNSELQKILSIAGNTLTVEGKLRHTYRSAATVKGASIAYPAILFMDNMDVRVSDTTQGFCVAGTYIVQSSLGKNLRLSGAPVAAVKFHDSFNNRFECVTESPSALSPGYGVWLTGESQDNELGGVGQGISRDVANGGNNYVWGRQYFGSSAASGVANPMAWWYRSHKPTTVCSLYGAGTAILVPASATNPAEVMINGRVYRNTSTIVCDPLRTITPQIATVGGMMRGPMVATQPLHMYAVPSMFPSATRQWTLMLDRQSPATGPTPAATYPHWSWLGAAISNGDSGLHAYSQVGDDWIIRNSDSYELVNKRALFSSNATFIEVPVNYIPVGAKQIHLWSRSASDGWRHSNNVWAVYLTNRDWGFNVSDYQTVNRAHGVKGLGGVGASIRQNQSFDFTIALATNPRGFSYRNSTTATIDWGVYLRGYTLDRSAYK